LNRGGPRFSGDIDIFQDSEVRLVTAAEADAAALVEAGLKLSWGKVQTGKRQAQIEGIGETMQLEWVADSDFRFFPAQPDELFGYVLHPVDLATNKASAAADRREPRDIIDLVTIHESILPLGAVICAAVGRFLDCPRKKCWPKSLGTAASQQRSFECWQRNDPLRYRMFTGASET
jgi:hypothetical protein